MVDFGESNHWNLCVQLGGGAWHADNQICAATYAQLQLSSATKNSTWTAAAVAHLDAEIAKDASTVGAWNCECRNRLGLPHTWKLHALIAASRWVAAPLRPSSLAVCRGISS